MNDAPAQTAIHLPATARWLCAALGLYVLAAGLLGLGGWLAGVPQLTDWDNAGIAIQPDDALAASVMGVALLLLAWSHRKTAAGIAAVAALIAASALFGYFSGIDPGIDALRAFERISGRAAALAPGPMRPLESLWWLLLGTAVVLALGAPIMRQAAAVIGLAAAGIATLSLIGYVLGAGALYSLPGIREIGLQTSTMLLGAGLGLVAALPDRQPTRTLLEHSAAGMLARRALPFILVLPIVLGFLGLRGQAAGLVDTALGTELMVLMLIVTMGAVLWWCVAAVAERERALAAVEQQLRLITDATPALISYIDREQRYRFVNRKYEQWFGHERDEAIGRTMAEMLGEAAMERLRPHVERVLRGEDVHFDLEVPHREGGTRWIEVHYVPDRETSGQVAGFFVLVVDITGRKYTEEALRESEARVSAILEQLPVGVGLVRTDGRMILSNRMMRAFVPDALPSHAPKHVGQWRAFSADGSSLTPTEWPIARALRGVTVDPGVEFSFRREDGEELWMIVSAVPFRSDDGTVIGAISVMQDISERKRGETALRQSEERLRDADRRKDEFLATLAHELRNPLAPLVTSLEIIKRADNDRALLARARGAMERQISHMVRLIDDLLDVSRIASNKLELRKERIDLAALAREAADARRPLIDAAGHQLSITLPAEPIHVQADPVRITQVIGNLLSNATKFTRRGGRLSLIVERESGHAVIRVADTGIGIPPDKLGDVFELFTQIDRSLERGQSGLGIGLTLVKRLVEMHGGSVSAHSEGSGRGSEFVVHLPLAVAQPTAASPAEAAGASAAALAPVPADLHRILVADDNVDGAQSLAALLKLDGHEVVTAHDGVEALDKATMLKPDLILLDIGMPKMNGYEVCRTVRKQPWGADVLIVALSGWGQSDDLRKSQEAGFNGHLVKPVDHDALLKRLAELQEIRA
ncbi:MAG TPA: PAS domain-containing protein [Burkholderiaceae bacterium]|nr:PAS domain-containing protein [Burkholderiaceae bacterium]